MDLAVQLMAVAFVLALLLAALWLLRRRLGGYALAAGEETERMRRVSVLRLTPHATLHLVELHGRRYLIAVTPNHVHTLALTSDAAPGRGEDTP
jgi:flagellar biogenesis protein FliO